MIKHGITLLALTFAGLSCNAQAVADSKPAVVAVRAGRILDVRSGKYLAKEIIWIVGDRIQKIGPESELALQLPADAQIIDLSRFTILPGLIDSHTHLTGSPDLLGNAWLHMSGARWALHGVKNAKLTLEAGFTTVRDLGSGAYVDIALRDAINEGDVIGPRMLACGEQLSITGGHGDDTYLAPEFNYSDGGVADGTAAVTHIVRRNIKYGADVIKMMATGGVTSEADDPRAEQFSPEEMRAIVETAHRLGRKVAAHAHGSQGIKDAVLAGVDSIEHGSFIDDEGIQLMKTHGTYLVPTLYQIDWGQENAGKTGMTPNMLRKTKLVYSVARQNIGHALREGVKVALGTDAAMFPHGLNARELGAMVRLGLTPLQSIQAGTINAADLLGWADRIGALEPGKFADLIAVDGDPLSDVTVLEHVTFVMKGGAVFKNEQNRRSEQ